MGTQLFYYSISTAILILFGFVLVLLASSAFAIMSASTSAGHNVWDEDWEQQADVGPVLCPYRFLKIYISISKKASANRYRPSTSSPRRRRKSHPKSPKHSAERSRPNLTVNYGPKRMSLLGIHVLCIYV